MRIETYGNDGIIIEVIGNRQIKFMKGVFLWISSKASLSLQGHIEGIFI